MRPIQLALYICAIDRAHSLSSMQLIAENVIDSAHDTSDVNIPIWNGRSCLVTVVWRWRRSVF